MTNEELLTRVVALEEISEEVGKLIDSKTLRIKQLEACLNIARNVLVEFQLVEDGGMGGWVNDTASEALFLIDELEGANVK